MGLNLCKEWTRLTLPETHVLTKDCEAWQKLFREINGAFTTNHEGKKGQSVHWSKISQKRKGSNR